MLPYWNLLTLLRMQLSWKMRKGASTFPTSFSQQNIDFRNKKSIKAAAEHWSSDHFTLVGCYVLPNYSFQGCQIEIRIPFSANLYRIESISGVGFEASIFTAALKKWLGKAAKVVETWVFGGGYVFLSIVCLEIRSCWNKGSFFDPERCRIFVLKLFINVDLLRISGRNSSSLREIR